MSPSVRALTGLLAGALLVLSPLALLLPAGWRTAAAALLLAAGWLLARHSRRERAVVYAGFGLFLAVALLATALSIRAGREDPERELAEVRAAVLREWNRLDGEAARVATALGPAPAGGREEIATAFRALTELAAASELHHALIDPGGTVVAWAGGGLTPALRAGELPAAGRVVRASFGAFALVTVHPLAAAAESGWRLVLARQFALDEWGVPVEPLGGHRLVRRLFFPDGEGEPVAGRASSSGPEMPGVELAPEPASPAPTWSAPRQRAERALPWVLAAALVAFAVARGVGQLLLRGTVFAARPSRFLAGPVLYAALGAVQVGLGLPPAWLVVTALAAALTVAGLRAGESRGWRFLATVLSPLVAAAAWFAEARWGPLPLDGPGWLGPEALSWRLPLVGLAFGSLLLAGRTPRDSKSASGTGWAVAALVALTGAALGGNRPGLALGVFLLAGPLAGRAASLLRRRETLRAWLGIALLAAVQAAVALEIAAVWEARRSLRTGIEEFSPPEPEVREALEAEIATALGGADPTRFAPAAALDPIDLPFAIWRRSPLARRDALSALAVSLPGGRTAAFSWGLPLTASGELDPGAGPWSAIDLPGWSEALVWGESEMPAGDLGPLGVRFWLLPRPGYHASAPPPGDLAAGLLRGGPALGFDLPAWRGAPRFAFFSNRGEPLVTPWPEAPPRLPALPSGARFEGRLAAPDGNYWTLARAEGEGIVALLLRERGMADLIERAGAHLLAVAVWLLAIAGGLAAAAMPRTAVRAAVRRAVRSYSRRLILLFTLLVLVPVVLFTLFGTAAIGRRLEREQRRAGEAALASAERVLGEYLLTLEPGFGLDTVLDDDLLTWLARVVQHQVALYWSGQVHATSRRELYTSGLLSRQLPGEVQERLTLRGQELVSRTSRAGGLSYLELFAPLRMPGMPPAPGGLVLAMPQLAEQEELAAELLQLRRRALLIASALFAGLVALALRLAGGFTRPLAELVESTRRIAAGEPAFARRPEEAELAALVEAVEVMAREIATGRDRLVREKELIERIVDQVTAGVISLDAAGVVLLANPAAERLLGIGAGEHLRHALAARPRLAPLERLVAGGLAAGEREAVRIPAEDGPDREWSVAWVAMPGQGETASLLVVEDDTEVLRGQRLEAWAEMARLIAHEIKNPLTPIRLSIEHLREVWQRDRERFPEALDRCIRNILRQVEELRTIAGEFATYAGVPALERSPGDLVPVVREIVAAYDQAPEDSSRVELTTPESLVLRFDARLLGRALRNLVENGLRAAGEGGRVRVEVRRCGEGCEVAVRDSGPGIAPELLSRVFEPYFSTEAGGTGLGLPIARRIVEGHGGTLVARNLETGGLEVVLRLPGP